MSIEWRQGRDRWPVALVHGRARSVHGTQAEGVAMNKSKR